MKEKIQKILSASGYGSRRTIEKYIMLGMVIINNKRVMLGERFCLSEIKNIFLRNKKILLNQDAIRVLIYNKPLGEICSLYDSKKRNLVFRNLPKITFSRWINVGRLDINSSGLLIFTNFGELAFRLMHPKYMIPREYLVRIFGNISEKKINMLKHGIKINNLIYKFEKIFYHSKKKKNIWLKIILLTGKNREIRKSFNAIEIQVNKIIRIKYGNIFLPKHLKSGKYIELKYVNVKKTLKLVNL